MRNFVLTQDTHEPDAVEFAQFPPHCVRGTWEAETVEAFTALPFFDADDWSCKRIRSTRASIPVCNEWLEAHPEVDTFIVVGDCTDLCTYQLAMHLRLDANASQLPRRVIVPANCVQTYDRPSRSPRNRAACPTPVTCCTPFSSIICAQRG